MRTRVGLVVGAALALVAIGVVVTLSHRAVRDAGSDHVSPEMFAATIGRDRRRLCQVSPYLPPSAATAQIVIGTYGRPVPDLTLRFTDPAGRVVSSGHLAAGARQGPVSIPISPAGRPGSATKLCLTVGGHSKVVIGGMGIPVDPSDETVGGVVQHGRISVVYNRAGEESWWSILGEIDTRFGLGKATFFGDWTLPACVLLLLGTWAITVRLLLRESR